MDIKFERGDIIKFKNKSDVRPDLLNHVENIYKIKSINGTKVTIGRDFALDIETDLFALESVKMDGIEDKYIYYDPIVAATTIKPGHPVPEFHTNYTYYLENESTFLHNETMRDIVSKNGFTQVHQLQHYLREHFQSDDLKINV